MTADDVEAGLAAGTLQLIDVRSADEYSGATGYQCDAHQGHIEGAINIDVEAIAAALDPLALLRANGVDPDGTITCYCHSGQRSARAAALLHAAGITQVTNYVGSWHEWCARS